MPPDGSSVPLMKMSKATIELMRKLLASHAPTKQAAPATQSPPPVQMKTRTPCTPSMPSTCTPRTPSTPSTSAPEEKSLAPRHSTPQTPAGRSAATKKCKYCEDECECVDFGNSPVPRDVTFAHTVATDTGQQESVTRTTGLGFYRRKETGKWREPNPLKPCPFSKDRPCCHGKATPCFLFFGDKVDAWRTKHLWIKSQSRDQLRTALRDHLQRKRLPQKKKRQLKSAESATKQVDQPYCRRFQTWWTGFSSEFFDWKGSVRENRRINGGVGGLKSASKADRSQTDIGIMAWFEALKPSLEMQPDKAEFHVGAALRKDVCAWYEQDSRAYPHIFPRSSTQYFLSTWRTYTPEVKLRRYLRFTKCADCSSLRQVCWDKTKYTHTHTDTPTHHMAPHTL